MEEEEDNLTLHYAMLEYIYDNHKLAASIFNNTWEDFIRENPEYSQMTAAELKTIFWTDIVKNIEDKQYSLLTAKHREYFDPEEFPCDHRNELFQSLLEHNEPKAGVDFTFYPSTSAYGSVNDQTLRQQNPDEMMETIKKAFANPTLYSSVFDDDLTEVDEEDTRINVIAQKPTMEIDTGEDPFECFKEILLTMKDIEAGKTELTEDEVLERLADDNLDIDFDDLPDGLQYYVKQFGNSVLYTEAAAPAQRTPRPVTSTPLVTGGITPSFRTRSMSTASDIQKERRLQISNFNANVQSSPQRTRLKRNTLFASRSDTTLSDKK